MLKKESIKEIFVDEDLKSITITKLDGELIAHICNYKDKEIIQANDILIRFNYGEEYKFIKKDGKIFIDNK
jgi:hypothetical protein